MKSIHPELEGNLEGAKTLIVGTMLPPRICDGVLDGSKLKDLEDVYFFYESYKNQFYPLISLVENVVFSYKNTKEAIQERIDWLKKNHYGMADIIKSCIQKDDLVQDSAIDEESIEYNPIDELLEKYPNITSLIFTSERSLFFLKKRSCFY